MQKTSMTKYFRDDEEWLVNRKLMNAMLLRNDFKLAQNVIENVSDDMINEWNGYIGERGYYIPITGLMAALYTWAIKGTYKIDNVALCSCEVLKMLIVYY